MSISLKKGGKVSLAKQCELLNIPKLTDVAVGLGWNVSRNGPSMDLDAWAILVNKPNFNRSQVIYFGNKKDYDRTVIHQGDNLTGEGDGDDETININLKDIDYNEITDLVLLGVTIYRAKAKRQSFRDVDSGFIRLYDCNTNIELCKYSDEFNGTFANYSTMLFGALVKVNGEWEFRAIGEGLNTDSIHTILGLLSMSQINNLLSKGDKKMGVSLKKGGKVSLAKVAADAGIQGGLTKVVVGLGWDVNKYSGGGDFDLDAAAFLTGADGKTRNENDFVFYGSSKVDAQGRKCDLAESVIHTGDNRTGAGDGDDEQILVDLTKVPADVQKISFTCTIFEGETKGQNFGSVENSFIRVMDEATGTELLRYDLGEDYSVETALVVAELYRHNGEWKFNAVGAGFAGGLAALCGNFGIDVE